MTTTRVKRSDEERRAVVESVDLRIHSGGMSHREATRLEGISDALVHSWRRSLQKQSNGNDEGTPMHTEPQAATPDVKGPRKNANRAAAAKAPNPAFTFLVEFMEEHPDAAYADAAAAAKEEGLTIFPIMWGRAQVVLGRVKAKPRGSGKAAAAKVRARKVELDADAASHREDEPAASTASVRRPRKAAPPATAAFPISADDVPRLAVLVDALNAGGKAVLRYAGDGWELAVE